jgi:hypothetical protein
VKELSFGPEPAHPERDRAEALTPLTIKLVNLTRQWITSLVPHVLSKRVKIEYGLLPRENWVNRTSDKPRSRAKTMGRKLLAVPYVGKDSPSEAAEFSSPDVIIGFTILAYAYEGLRPVDIAALLTGPKQVTELGAKCEFDVADGERPDNKERWGDWLAEFAGLRQEFKDASGPIHDRAAYKRYEKRNPCLFCHHKPCDERARKHARASGALLLSLPSEGHETLIKPAARRVRARARFAHQVQRVDRARPQAVRPARARGARGRRRRRRLGRQGRRRRRR